MAIERAYAAEAIGSLLLFATVIGSGIAGQSLAGGNVGLALLANALATAAMLHVLITTLGPVSGAHFNPAVSLVAALDGAMSWRRVPGYWGAQLGGGMIGVWLAHAMFALPIWQIAHHARDGWPLWISEALASAGLLFAIRATKLARSPHGAANIALYILAAYWFTASTSFANPAITVARAFSDTFAGIAPHSVPVFVVCQFIGALAGDWLARWLFAPCAPATAQA